MAVYKLMGIKRVDLGYKSVCNLSVALADGTGTTLTLDVAADPIFAAFTQLDAAHPVKLVVQTGVEPAEIMYASGYNPTTHTVTLLSAAAGGRGAEGSFAGPHGTGTGNVFVRSTVRLNMANAFNINANINNLTFQGDGTQELVPVSNGITGTMAASKWTTDILDKALAAAKLTTVQTPPDETSRWLPEIGSYPYVEGMVKLKGINDSGDGSDVSLKITIFKMKVQKPWVPANAGNNAVQGMDLAWTSIQTQTDLLGGPIPNSVDGVHYAIGVLATA
jgi:hypothetical protein